MNLVSIDPSQEIVWTALSNFFFGIPLNLNLNSHGLMQLCLWFWNFKEKWCDLEDVLEMIEILSYS